jgi:hypothetical protein
MFAYSPRRNTFTPVLMGWQGGRGYLQAAFGLVERYGIMGLVVASSLQFVARGRGQLAPAPGGVTILAGRYVRRQRERQPEP